MLYAMNTYTNYNTYVVFGIVAKECGIILLLAQTLFYVANSYTKYKTDVLFDTVAGEKKFLSCWRK